MQLTGRLGQDLHFRTSSHGTLIDRFRGCPRHVGAYARAVLTLEHGPQ